MISKAKSKINKQSIENAFLSLENRTMFKLICGASLTDPHIVKSLTTIFSLAGTDIIDIAPTMTTIRAADEGIEKAKNIFESNPKKYPYYKEPVIMISLNSGDDPHFKTASINGDLCKACQQCIPECSFSAITLQRGNACINVNTDICYGCGKCTGKCPNNAITLVNNRDKLESILTKLIDYSISGIEIHTGTSSKESLFEYYNRVKNILGNDFADKLLFSFSLESSMFTSKEFVEYAKHITSFSSIKPLIQVDGTPMSGNSLPSSSLQSLAAAQVLIRSNIEAYVTVSGGINHLTKKQIRDLELDCNGIAMGTFARKLVWSYLPAISEEPVFTKAIQIATNLVKGMEF